MHQVEWHLAKFEKMAKNLAGYTKTCVISFIDLYKKVERNFPEASEVSREDRICLGKECIRIAGECGREPVLAFWEMTLELTTPVPILKQLCRLPKNDFSIKNTGLIMKNFIQKGIIHQLPDMKNSQRMKQDANYQMT